METEKQPDQSPPTGQLNIPTVIVGMGEVGKAHYELLSQIYPVLGVDLDATKCQTNMSYQPETAEVLLISVRFSDKFKDIVNENLEKYKPRILNILSTVPCGTTEQFGNLATHSTSRGAHPLLSEGLKKIKKFVGGGNSPELKIYFESAGIPCEIFRNSRTTELLHLLNNMAYGISIAFADEAQKLCRQYGVDYFHFMKYTESNNTGFRALDMPTKMRTIATPPNGHIGGHCVVSSANLIPEELRTPMINILAHYND